MSRPIKTRKFGLSRNDHRYAPLHPYAQDSRVTNATSEPAIDDLPESSSEEETPAPHIKSARVTSSTLSFRESPKLSVLSTDSPFSTVRGQKPVRQTYGKLKTKAPPEIYKNPRINSNTSTRTQDQRNLGQNPSLLGGRSTSLKHSKSAELGARRQFHEPSATAKDTKSSSRDLARPQLNGSDEPLSHGSNKAASSKTKGAFKTPKTLEQTTKIKRKTFTEPQSLMSSVGSSPPPSSTPPIKSSCTAASQTVDPIDIGIKHLHDEPDNRCPICGASVDEEQLDDLRALLGSASHRKREVVSRQTEFCRSHREADARRLWNDRGYPEINWSILPKRLEDHLQALSETLNGTRHSFFRQRLQEQLDVHRSSSKRARETLMRQFQRECDTSEDVGYYGGKGAAICMAFIANKLGSQLQKLGAQDPLIPACGGVASYEQLVLLPELCSLLVLEDQRRLNDVKHHKTMKKKFKVAQGSSPTENELVSARAILRESAELGRLIWDEENEDVGSTDSEDDGLCIEGLFGHRRENDICGEE